MSLLLASVLPGNSGVFLLQAVAMPVAAATNALEEKGIPDLKPPMEILPPPFLEVYGRSVFLFLLVLFVGMALLIWRLTRPRTVLSVPPDVAARRALEALAGQPENGVLALDVARQLRRYTQAVMGLPLEEWTTEQVLSALQRHERMSAVALERLTAVLKDCDAMAFAPVPASQPLALSRRALEVAAEIELLRKPPVTAA